ncbi:MAG: LPS export ABC transporter permease LptG [Deltaproteobacteria bacterium]|nr:LPS export ABC transporter permease LptG [Candidatus Anaeroferrophillus wilburensis]MBN2888910.1 LPS export ABC transporter permease LptG [Deltaproteobacteria bacterium]
MRLYQRYLTKEFLQIFTLSLLALLSIYLLLEFFGSLDDFIENHVGPFIIIVYLFNQLPFYASQFIPLSLLLATMLTLGSMGQNNELVAFRACGFTLRQLSLPLIIVGICAALLTFAMTEYLVPATFARAKHIKTVIIKQKKEKKLFNLQNVWYTGQDYIYHFKELIPEEDTIRGATIYQLDEQSCLIRRVDAEKIVYQHGIWTGFAVNSRTFSYHEGRSDLQEFNRQQQVSLAISEQPKDFLIPQKAVEEMNFRELQHYIDKVKNIGIDVTEYEVQRYHKLFFPLACPIMVLLGIPFSLGGRRSGGTARGIGLSLVIGFSFWFILSFSLALGKGGVMSPAPAALLPHLLYGVAGLGLIQRKK